MLRRFFVALLVLTVLDCAGAEPRAKWENTRLTGSPDGPPSYRAVRAWPELSTRPLVTAVPEPGGKRMLYIEQQAADWDASMTLKAFTDPAKVETLLEFPGYAYTIAFHPHFAENHYVFFGVNEPADGGRKHSRILRYTMRDGRPDPASRKVIIEWDSNGHNGAAMAFGNDGLLFVTSGDGTSDGDADLAGQNTRLLRSKVLRINVDTPGDVAAYTVPADNPFVDAAGFAPETWAYGLRNPWRLTFDAASGQLWAGENGQDQWEYARLIERGANYGWSRYEGGHEFNHEHPLGPRPNHRALACRVPFAQRRPRLSRNEAARVDGRLHLRGLLYGAHLGREARWQKTRMAARARRHAICDHERRRRCGWRTAYHGLWTADRCARRWRWRLLSSGTRACREVRAFSS
jgi:hypothetical protein